jgi:hypothetical protein
MAIRLDSEQTDAQGFRLKKGKQWQPEGALLLGRREGRVIGWNDDQYD